MSAGRVVLTILCLALVAAGFALKWHSLGSIGETASRVDFNRDIRPILHKHCTSCHGGVKQQGSVSFIYREQALGKGKSGRPTVVPGRPSASELMARVTAKDPEARMPYHAPPLKARQIALLKDWIAQGAPWDEYWAFVPPKPQPWPAVARADWPRQPLDRFILARLHEERLSPSPEAEKTELLRRVTFDLTGLPPTPAEIAAFLADTAADAYEKQVDRLLSSAHYGERWAALWLDLARYADSKGFQFDLRHTVWPYRDWLIDAFNQNVPYDRFIIKQLAGDLLPSSTIDDHIATTFHRLTSTNDEGGADDEEFRLVAVMDRVATTWSVLNGLTMNCVQCHSHPYDPIRHEEYYTSLAFFNTTRDGDFFDEAPLLRLPLDRSRSAEALRLQQEISLISAAIVDQGRQLERAGAFQPLLIEGAGVDEVLGIERLIADLESGAPSIGSRVDAFTTPEQELKKQRKSAIELARKRLMQAQSTPFAEEPLRVQDGMMIVTGNMPVAAVIELIARPASRTLTALRVEVPPKEPLKARHTPEVGFIVDRFDAWVVTAEGSEEKIDFRYFVADSEENLQRQVALAQFAGSRSTLVRSPLDAFAHAGSFAANPKLARARWLIGVPERPLRLDAGAALKVQLTQSQYIAAKPATVPRLRLSMSDDSRWTAFIHGPDLIRQLSRLLDADRRLSLIPTLGLPAMSEQPRYERRVTLKFERGNFLAKTGPELQPDVPRVLPDFPKNAPRNRLTLAQWFFSPEQPLTARVAVNRFWEQLFGLGLVETLEDFGSVGEQPTHPELLDHLAWRFQRDLRWNMKALLREIVTSATYRQSARTTPELLQKDPRNRLLARGPQQRLTAEMVRDQALLASGLLNRKIGGPPVMPPQPPGIESNVGDALPSHVKWIDATGEDRYRRAIYTFIKRNEIYPSFLTFDLATRDVSHARRIPTNTPLQALVTLNDPVYYEAAQALARHWLKNIDAPSGDSDVLDAQIIDGARRVLSRDLRIEERLALRRLYEDVLAHRGDGRARTTASSKTGVASPVRRAPVDDTRTLAALTAVASALLNVDAALTR